MVRGLVVTVTVFAIGVPGAGAAAAEGLVCPVEFAAAGGADPRSSPFEIERLEGRRTGAARRLAARHGCQLRVVRRNGRWLAVTEDYSTSRINVAVRDGRVRRALSVG